MKQYLRALGDRWHALRTQNDRTITIEQFAQKLGASIPSTVALMAEMVADRVFSDLRETECKRGMLRSLPPRAYAFYRTNTNRFGSCVSILNKNMADRACVYLTLSDLDGDTFETVSIACTERLGKQRVAKLNESLFSTISVAAIVVIADAAQVPLPQPVAEAFRAITENPSKK